MTFFLLTSFGVVLASGLLHAAIGLRRPLAWKHISFAFVAILLCCYFLGQAQVLRAHSPEEFVALHRRQYLISAGLAAGLGWFARAYTGVRVPFPLVMAYYGAIAAFVAASQLVPYGTLLGSAPVLTTVTALGGERLTAYTASRAPIQIGWLLLMGLFFGTATAMGVRMTRRGEHRRGVVFVIAFGIMILLLFVDLMGGPHFPRFGELGLLSIAVIMAIDLAVDFRAKEAELESAFEQLRNHSERITRMLETSLTLRDQLNTPLQTLELDLTIIADRAPELATRVARLRRTLDRLTDLGRRLQEHAIEGNAVAR